MAALAFGPGPLEVADSAETQRLASDYADQQDSVFSRWKGRLDATSTEATRLSKDLSTDADLTAANAVLITAATAHLTQALNRFDAVKDRDDVQARATGIVARTDVSQADLVRVRGWDQASDVAYQESASTFHEAVHVWADQWVKSFNAA